PKLPRVCTSAPDSEIEAATDPSGSEERIFRRRSASNGETTRAGEAAAGELNGCEGCGRNELNAETLGSTARGDPLITDGGADRVGVPVPPAFAWLSNSSRGSRRCACTIFN